jgi:hypothetical protein
MMRMIDKQNERGEQLFMKFHRNFRGRVDEVYCDGSGRVTVRFKNGYQASTGAQNIDSKEFLAECGMIYDL